MYIIGWAIAIFAELILAFVLKDFILLGFMVVTFGGMFLACLLHGDVKIRNMVIFMTGYCFLWGILIIGASVLYRMTGAFYGYDICIFMLGFGVALLLCGITMGVVKKVRCNRKISATFQGAQTYTVGVHTAYTPVFDFQYEGSHYSNTSGETFSKRKIQKKYRTGEQYDIYIDPRNPNSFCVRKKMEGTDLLLVLLGLLFIWAALLVVRG